MSTDDYVFNTKLVHAVRRRPWLYDYTMKEHNKRGFIQITWEKIAKEVDSTAMICKEIWRSLRINYNRCLQNPPSGSRATKKTYFLLHNMRFLKKFMKSRKTLREKPSSRPKNKMRSAPTRPTELEDKNQNVEDNRAHSSNAVNITVKSINSMLNKTPQASSTEPPSKKNNPPNTSAESSESQTEDRESPNQKFLLSLLPDLEGMDANQFRIFRFKACDLINSILESQQIISKSFEEVLSFSEPQQKPQILGEVSSMTGPLVSPQPIAQSPNKVSSMPKPTTSSNIDEDTDDEDLIALLIAKSEPGMKNELCGL